MLSSGCGTRLPLFVDAFDRGKIRLMDGAARLVTLFPSGCVRKRENRHGALTRLRRDSISSNSATTPVNTKEWRRITGDILGAAVGEESRRLDRQGKGDGARARAEGKVMVGRMERLRAKDSGVAADVQLRTVRAERPASKIKTKKTRSEREKKERVSGVSGLGLRLLMPLLPPTPSASPFCSNEDLKRCACSPSRYRNMF